MSIIENLKENWEERPLSEKRILAILGVLVVISVFYLLVVDTLVTWQAQEERKLLSNEKIYTQVTHLAHRFEQQKTASDTNSEGLATVIDKSLQENGLTMRGFQPGKNNDARLRLSDVAYEALVQWLYDVEYKHNITIEELSISQAKTAGLLIANIRVRQ